MNAVVPFMHPNDPSVPVAVAERELPRNLEAEQSLLGALLVAPEALDQVRDVLESHQFFQPVHGRIYDAIVKTADQGKRPSPTTLKQYFHRDEALSDVGGSTYLDKLAASVVSVVSARAYADAIVDTWGRRELIAACEATVLQAYDAEVGVSADLLAEQHSVAVDALRGIATDHEFFSAAQVSAAALASAEAWHKGQAVAVRTNLKALDDRVRLKAGQLVVIAGRPGTGKSAVAQMITTRTAQRDLDQAKPGQPVPATIFISLEMEPDEIGQRDMAMRTGIPYFRIGSGGLSNPEFQKIIAAGEDHARLPIILSTRRGLTVTRIRSRCKAIRRKREISAVVVDYLQLVSGEGRPGENPAFMIGSIAKGLKDLAGELGCPVIALSAINRDSEKQGENKRPTMSQLKWSGDIEAHADIIVLLYRPAKHDTDADPDLLECIVDKQRGGPAGFSVEIGYRQATSSFFDRDGVAQSNFDLGAARKPDGHPNAPGNA